MKVAACETTHLRIQGRVNSCADERGGGNEEGGHGAEVDLEYS